MLTTKIKSPANGLETSFNYIYDWYVLTIKFKGPADGLKTSSSPNSDVIQFSCTPKFCVYMNFFFY